MAGRFHNQVGADVQVEPVKAAVFRRGRVHVRYQTFRVLLCLLERRGQVVTQTVPAALGIEKW